MGKKKPEIMAKYSQSFLEGAEHNGCPWNVAQEIWDNIVKFGGYGFNKSHSAAYAMITWQTAFLKANYRKEFLAANMSCEMHDSDKIKDFVDDAQRASIPALPPCIQRSAWEFTPEEAGIRFGFGAIKGTGSKAIENVLAARERLRADGRAIELHALCAEADPSEVTKLCWEALIKSGSFDAAYAGRGANRGSLLFALDAAMADGARLAADRKAGQGSLFDAFSGDGGAANGAAAAPVFLDPARAWDQRATLKAESEVLGFYLTGHPLEEQSGLFSILSTTSTRRVVELAGGSEVLLGGLIVQL
jgi:DNA polymerase-3 subunit alpha